MRFLIVGAGALGGYYGGLLLRGGADVTFWSASGGRRDSRNTDSSSDSRTGSSGHPLRP